MHQAVSPEDGPDGSAGGGRRKHSAVFRRLALAALTVAIGYGCFVVHDEWRLTTLSNVARQAATPLTAAERQAVPACAGSTNPRELDICVILELRLREQELRAGPRDARLAEARRAASAFTALAPGSAIASAEMAMVDNVTVGGKTAAIAALAQSYRQARMQRNIGLWRVSYGARNWPDLDRPTRHAVLEEALWLVRLGRADRDLVLREIAGTEAYIPIAIRLPGRNAETLPLPAAP